MIKSYQMFLESSSYEDEVAAICKSYDIRNWSINKDGLVDVDSDVNIVGKGLTKIPLNFGKVIGNFNCQNNELTSLEGCPHTVTDGFYCQKNYLISLKGCPKKVGNNFWCNSNKLTSLEGCPKEVGIFGCGYNKIINLDGLVSANTFSAPDNPITLLTIIGRTMITKSISFLEAVSIHIKEIPDNELELIFQNISTQKILDLNDFKIFNLLRTHLPEKYKEVMSLRDVDVSADLGELGF